MNNGVGSFRIRVNHVGYFPGCLPGLGVTLQLLDQQTLSGEFLALLIQLLLLLLQQWVDLMVRNELRLMFVFLLP